MYGYIYKTTNILNNKIYIGKRKGNFDKDYFGSGKYLLKAIDKYGKDSFRVEIIEECFDLKHQNDREIYWISYYRNKNADMYNIANGGDGGNIYEYLSTEQAVQIKKKIAECNRAGKCGNKGKTLSSEHRRKISESNKGKEFTPEHIQHLKEAHKGQKAWNKGLTKEDPRVAKYCRVGFTHSDEIKKKISQGVKNAGIDWTKSEETKKKLSAALKGKSKSDEHKKKLHDRAIGRIWICNDIESKMIYPSELNAYLQLGYQKGRKFNRR